VFESKDYAAQNVVNSMLKVFAFLNLNSKNLNLWSWNWTSNCRMLYISICEILHFYYLYFMYPIIL